MEADLCLRSPSFPGARITRIEAVNKEYGDRQDAVLRFREGEVVPALGKFASELPANWRGIGAQGFHMREIDNAP